MIHRPTQFLILGLGKVGLPLAKQLTQLNYLVTGIKRSPLCEKTNFTVLLHDLTEKRPLVLPLTNSYRIIVLIPHGENYREICDGFFNSIPRLTIEQLIVSSSTSIYNDLSGKVDELTDLPIANKSSFIGLCEKAWQEIAAQINSPLTLLRLGGLYGEKRHPVYFLAGRKNCEKPHAPINLISHQKAASIITKICEKDPIEGVFNVVEDEHPSRQGYYQRMAREFSLIPPEFNQEDLRTGHLVDNTKIKNLLALSEL